MNAFENRNTQDIESSSLAHKGELSQNSSIAYAEKAKCHHDCDAPVKHFTGSEGEEYKEQAATIASPYSYFGENFASTTLTDEFVVMGLRMPSGELSPHSVVAHLEEDTGLLGRKIKHALGLPSCVLKLGGKCFEQGKLLSEFVKQGAEEILVLLSLVGGGGKGKKKGGALNQAKNAVVRTVARIQRPPMPQPAVTVGGVSVLSKCELNYAAALADPFSPAARGACANGSDALRTLKQHYEMEVTVTCGSNKKGFIYLTPSIANNTVQGFSTNSLYTGSTNLTYMAANDTLSTGIDANYCSALPYTVDDLSDNYNNGGVQGKIVAIGAQIDYMGTELNRGGQYILMHSATHANISYSPSSALNTGMNYSTLKSSKDARQVRVGGEPVALSVFGVTSDERNFPATTNLSVAQGLYPFSASFTHCGASNVPCAYADLAGINAGAPVAVIAIESEAGNIFNVKLIYHMEWAGSDVAGTTDQDTDDTTGDKIAACAVSMQESIKDNPTSDLWPHMYNELTRTAKKSIKFVVPKLASAVFKLLA